LWATGKWQSKKELAVHLESQKLIIPGVEGKVCLSMRTFREMLNPKYGAKEKAAP
jgi:hypothetical protein